MSHAHFLLVSVNMKSVSMSYYLSEVFYCLVTGDV